MSKKDSLFQQSLFDVVLGFVFPINYFARPKNEVVYQNFVDEKNNIYDANKKFQTMHVPRQVSFPRRHGVNNTQVNH